MTSPEVSQPSSGMARIDCVRPFVDLWEHISERSPAAIVEIWRREYIERLPEAVLQSWQRHRFPGDIEQAIPKVPAAVGGLLQRRDAALAAAEGSGGTSATDLPSRSGYYAGLRVVRALAESAPWPTIVRWDRETARTEIQWALSNDPA